VAGLNWIICMLFHPPPFDK